MTVTKECKIFYYKLNNGKCISFIDTPRVEDNVIYKENRNIKVYKDNINKFLYDNFIELKGMLFLVNFQEERFDSSEQEVLLILISLFPVKRFWNNLIIIFTHVFDDPDGDDLEDMMKKEIMQIVRFLLD